MKKNKLKPDPSLVVSTDLSKKNTNESIQKLLSLKDRPTAVIAFNDRSAVGLIDTLVRAGIDVPATVSVVGYDDSPIARLGHIDLTTVSQNTPTLTEQAVTGLIERLDGGRSDLREVVVQPDLVIRGTTAPPTRRRGARDCRRRSWGVRNAGTDRARRRPGGARFGAGEG